jgi:hypothetical protein
VLALNIGTLPITNFSGTMQSWFSLSVNARMTVAVQVFLHHSIFDNPNKWSNA